MEESELRDFFLDCKICLHIQLGLFCDRNLIDRADFSRFMKNQKHWIKDYQLKNMKQDILDNIKSFNKLYS